MNAGVERIVSGGLAAVHPCLPVGSGGDDFKIPET